MFKPTIYVKSIIQLLLIFALAWIIFSIRGLLVYLLIAALITLVTKPLVNFICQKEIRGKHIPRGLISAAVVALLITSSIVVSTFVFPRLISEFSVLSRIDFGGAYQAVINEISSIKRPFLSQQFDMISLEENIRTAISNLLSFHSIESTATSILGGLGNIAIALFSVIFILFFFLKEANLTRTVLDDYMSDKLASHLKNILPKIKKTLFRYFIGLLAQMTGVFLIVYLGLSIAGVESALVIAVFAAFINLIPYIGPMIGASFGLILGLGQAIAIDPTIIIGVLALKIVLVFGITQITDNFLFQPLIFSNSINAHPLEIFIVISIAGLLAGVLGMIIAVPTYSMIRIVIKEFFTNSRFVQSFTRNV